MRAVVGLTFSLRTNLNVRPSVIVAKELFQRGA